MPRRNRTFTDSDIIRLTIHNLDRGEKLGVLATLCGITPDIPTPEPPPRPVPPTNKIRVNLTISLETVSRIKTFLGILSKIPGPQKKVLTLLNTLVDLLESVLRQTLLLLRE